MSFGAAAASGGFVRVSPDGRCPCDAGRYDGCCGPILAGDPAPSAEQLMRSRYTAFVLGDAEHLRRTWHPRTRPDDLALDPATRWLGLQVLVVQGGGASDEAGSVEFRARWVGGAEQGTLHECSRFVRRGGRWVYLDSGIGDGTIEAASAASA